MASTPTRTRLGADAVADAFERHGITRLYVFPGGTIAPIFVAALSRGIEIFTARHEQGAGYSALAAARLSGTPQVAMVTSGPGVTNIVTCVADAYFDSTPLVVITGQVGTGDMRGTLPVRQRGFQEVDTLALMAPITKEAILPRHPDELADAVERAFRIAGEGRPGPVVLDIPADIQRGAISEDHPMTYRAPARPEPDAGVLDEMADAIAGAQRPVIIAGQGVLLAGAQAQLRRLATARGIPVSQSLLGLGAFPTDHELALGYHGHTGNQCAGLAIHHADVVLVVGSRLDLRQTGSEVNAFAEGGRVLRVDLDSAELDYSRIRTDLGVLGDAREVLGELETRLASRPSTDISAWRAQVDAWREAHALRWDDGGMLKPQRVITTANRMTAGEDVIAVTGVGSHQQWVARHFDFDHPRRALLTSGGHGAMGYDLPSAVGAAMNNPDRRVICFVGDGSLQINIQELAAIVEQKLAVKIVVLDNHRLGIVSQFQLINWEDDPTCGKKWNPDFAAIARAYGIPAWTVDAAGDVEGALRESFDTPGPTLVHCLVDPVEDIVPMLLAGQTMAAMWSGPE